ncbi:MAG: hypothetical protein JOZ65_17735 [Chloroflexi bacterium]|nr:hypothetical protein [Chloroflexota bacterium]
MEPVRRITEHWGWVILAVVAAAALGLTHAALAGLLIVGLASAGVPPLSPVEVAERFVLLNYGSSELDSFQVLHQEPFGDGQLVVFRFFNSRLSGGARPTAVLVRARPRGYIWEQAGGGAIGTVAVVDAGYAVSCAWTWIDLDGSAAASTAGFYCAVDDSRE